MPYLKMTLDQYLTWFEDQRKSRSSTYYNHHRYNPLSGEKPPKTGWEFMWMPIGMDQAVRMADKDPERVLYADTLDEAELLLDESHAPPEGMAGMKYHTRELISGETCLVLFEQLILPDVPDEDDEDEWEALGQELMGKGRVYYFNIPADWKEDGRRKAFGNIIVDCQEQTIEYSPKRVRAMESARQAAETRKGRTIPTDVWKHFFERLLDSYISDGPLAGVVHKVSMSFRVTRGSLWPMIEGYLAVNGNAYRRLGSYKGFMEAAEAAVPYMREATEKSDDSDELELVEWIETELKWLKAKD